MEPKSFSSAGLSPCCKRDDDGGDCCDCSEDTEGNVDLIFNGDAGHGISGRSGSAFGAQLATNLVVRLKCSPVENAHDAGTHEGSEGIRILNLIVLRLLLEVPKCSTTGREGRQSGCGSCGYSPLRCGGEVRNKTSLDKHQSAMAVFDCFRS